jgi:hypothetical protein
MNLVQLIRNAFITFGLAVTLPAFATVTYTYTDVNEPLTYSGSFSVTNALADGSYSFLSTAAQPAGFTENFFDASFVDGQGVTRTPSLSLFDITISSGQVSLWDIRATTTFTSYSYSTCGRKLCPSPHYDSVLIFHDTNVPYLPGGGLAYQATIPNGDYKTYHNAYFAYQEALTGFAYQPGVWSVASVANAAPSSAVPEPESLALFGLGLAALAFVRRRKI